MTIPAIRERRPTTHRSAGDPSACTHLHVPRIVRHSCCQAPLMAPARCSFAHSVEELRRPAAGKAGDFETCYNGAPPGPDRVWVANVAEHHWQLMRAWQRQRVDFVDTNAPAGPPRLNLQSGIGSPSMALTTLRCELLSAKVGSSGRPTTPPPSGGPTRLCIRSSWLRWAASAKPKSSAHVSVATITSAPGPGSGMPSLATGQACAKPPDRCEAAGPSAGPTSRARRPCCLEGRACSKFASHCPPDGQFAVVALAVQVRCFRSQNLPTWRPGLQVLWDRMMHGKRLRARGDAANC